jgi:hypothetical protein
LENFSERIKDSFFYSPKSFFYFFPEKSQKRKETQMMDPWPSESDGERMVKQIDAFLKSDHASMQAQGEEFVEFLGRCRETHWLNALKWAYLNGLVLCEALCASAAMHGHLDILKWARSNNCPWDEMTCACAAMHGHLDILKWARSNGCPWDETTCSNAAMSGLPVSAHEDGEGWTCVDDTQIVDADRMSILRRLQTNMCKWHHTTCTDFSTLEWATENQCPWDSRTLVVVCIAQRWDLVQSAISRGCLSGKIHGL